MKIISKSILLILLVTILPLSAIAQGGSNYTIFGIGDLGLTNGAVYNGMAGTCLAVPSDYAINLQNPALWSLVKTTRLQAGYLFNQHVADESNLSNRQNNGKVDEVLMIFQVDTALGLGISIGLNSYSAVNYYVSAQQNINYDGNPAYANVLYLGQGGISNGYIGAGIKLPFGFSLGGEIHANFGIINHSTTTIVNINDVTTYNYTYVTEYRDNLSGMGFKGGLYWNIADMFGIGAFYEKNQNLNITDSILYHSPFYADTGFTSNYDVRLPDKYGLGISYKNEKFLLAADYTVQDFSNFDYLSGPSMTFKKNKTVRAGLSIFGNKSMSEPLINRLTFNFGFGYNQLYYKINNVNLDEVYGSFGLGIPIVGKAIIDASVTIGRRGTNTNDLIREYYGRLNVNISLGDIWFHPFKREY